MPSREYLCFGEVSEWVTGKGRGDTRIVKKMIKQGLPTIEINRKLKLVAIEDLRAFLAQRKRVAGDDTDELVKGILEGLG